MSRKLIAILRGITPDEAEAVAAVLLEEGFDWIEVPLNSPEAFLSIERIARSVGDVAHIGAGTVTDVDNVGRVQSAGGTYIVSPNYDADVIMRTKALGMGSYPGVFSPTECFAALKAGADALKLFPASMIGTSGVKAISAVLPASTDLYAVGGVSAENLSKWRDSGIDGYGIGTALYQPDKSLDDIRISARQFVKAYDA
ncbi:2-dehydro-3-deoxy-6-phosphogalactonate aldolase [Leucothrix pacifica]|uniref:2-dehydro-3-deoxy-6-phosphogalactonate aldolase n=1 Tax=Leucothrix pacifica TaxID=1247513 RepID=A0A317CCB0_9GAMM|nr:2-dehydro-3-deoxy-6-phosphogalactonate aldolase [Leucothrix pacifica]PWQ96017.1 2-dehydro-3-deoxy-6-phosphogalactonate aldolase [Leucothrix pacifica]